MGSSSLFNTPLYEYSLQQLRLPTTHSITYAMVSVGCNLHVTLSCAKHTRVQVCILVRPSKAAQVGEISRSLWELKNVTQGQCVFLYAVATAVEIFSRGSK